MARLGKKPALTPKPGSRNPFHVSETSRADRSRLIVGGGAGKTQVLAASAPDEAFAANNAEALVAKLATTPTADRPRMRAVLLQLLALYPPEPAEPSAALPDIAPEFWAERDLNRRENAAQFIRRVYAPWLGRGLARRDISRLDANLYKALSVWLSRHKDDDITQLLPSQSDKIDELIDRLAGEYSIEDLRRLGYAIDSRLRRRTA